MSFSVNVDPTNPGQFFACCGLLELADRLWPGAEGWFAGSDCEFHISVGDKDADKLGELLQEICAAGLSLLDPDDIYSGRIGIATPRGILILDWWHELGGRADAKDLKVWAGTMESCGIARAMQHTMRSKDFTTSDLFNIGCIAYTSEGDKKEPYYFDARRGPNAHSRDVGFSPNDLSMTTETFPAVELLCLVGIQRCLPIRTDEPRIYDYFTWSEPVKGEAAQGNAANGVITAVKAAAKKFTIGKGAKKTEVTVGDATKYFKGDAESTFEAVVVKDATVAVELAEGVAVKVTGQ